MIASIFLTSLLLGTSQIFSTLPLPFPLATPPDDLGLSMMLTDIAPPCLCLDKGVLDPERDMPG